ncbi:MAG: DMT family transporter [Clostridiales bacterium]|nr:DMT family transporter [Clostridiales bacterium]
MRFLGELAALGAALSWTVNSLVLERHGRGFSAWALNALTKLGGLVAVSLLALFTQGALLPRADASQWLALLLSGLLGFSIGDGFLYIAFQQIGARRTLLIFAANPVLAALLGWVFLGEALNLLQILGILLALLGIMTVIAGDVRAPEKAVSRTGLLFAALAALGQAAGVLLSKLGMLDLGAVPAAQIRLVGGTLGMALILSLLRQWRLVPPILKSPGGRTTLAFSVLLGTLVGMVLSMQSIKLIPAAVASVLFSLMPVMILPISAFFLKEKVTARETLGALVAVGGVALLFL